MHRWLCFLALLSLLALSGCAAQKRRAAARRQAVLESREREARRPPQVVGTITLVNAEDSFVLIDCGPNPSPQPGAMLQTPSVSPDAAELRVSEVRRRPFVIADIVKGVPAKGDRAFLPSAAPAAASAAAEDSRPPTTPPGPPLRRSTSTPY